MPPSDADDEALREYGRQLAMDGLLRDMRASEARADVIDFPRAKWNRRDWLMASAASIAAMSGFAAWKFGKGGGHGGDQLALLDPRWMLVAAIGTDYRILGPNHIELTSGELHLVSKEPAKLLVETPNGKATANGTDFFIGHLGAVNGEQTKSENKFTTNAMTRLLVLAGTVALTTAQGNETAGANEAIVAEAGQAPEKILVRANSDFALNLYSGLAQKNDGGNLFFSPYSISNVLMMVAEGARGVTALEMGKVLGFPQSLLRQGDDAQRIPWETAGIQGGLSRLNQLIGGKGALSAEQEKLKKEEASLLKQLEELRRKVSETENDFSIYEAAEEIVEQVNAVRKKIESITLKIASAVWIDRKIGIEEPWRKAVTGTFGPDAIGVADFAGQPDLERTNINTWIEKQTDGRIRDFFDESSVTVDTRVVLANAVYFKGDWLSPFPEKNTKERIFTMAGGERIQAALMNQNYHDSCRYAAFNGDGSFFETPKTVPYGGVAPATYPAQDGFAMLELPYKGGSVSMVVIAPNDPNGLGALEKKLTSQDLEIWLGKLDKRKAHVLLPKFKMEESYDLLPALKAMGMMAGFDAERADFSGIGTSGQFPLYLGKVSHKTIIEVNEKGTEAVAVTGVGAPGAAIRRETPFFPEFNADRPFIYLIRDNVSGSILFLGRVMDPTR